MTPQKILETYWGHTSFRPLQEDIIHCITEGKDALAILPTGGGKSICFQVPAMLKEGCCLVISPLIALMEDQVQNLTKKGIPAAAIIAGMTIHETKNILSECINGALKFLYVSPERLETKLFLDHIDDLSINLIAVDEAHCISQWGYDFRPSYLKIAKLRELLPEIPMIALTASATPVVKEDLLEKLKMKKAQTFMTSFVRQNLVYTAEPCLDKINRMLEIISKVQGSGIIYCKTRRKTKEISDILQQHGIKSDFYHAGLEQEYRKEKLSNWLSGKIRIMVCTNAFGMGIDKANVRLVLHADMPDCVENYYQEAGRAGRDGNKSYAVLLYNEMEITALMQMPDIKFPNIKIIRNVYQALANYFQVPNGLGADQYFDFEIDDFIQKFKLNLNEIIYSLQALKQERIISYLEQVYKPSSAQFVCNKNDLEEFEKNHSDCELVAKALLRSYSGIFDTDVRINEKQLAKIIKRDLGFVNKQLEILEKNKIINYSPKKETPQICYLQNKIKTEELNLNYNNYLKRKNQYINRINHMILFAKTDDCRSTYVGNYFGDDKIMPCEKCDNCLALKKAKLNTIEFDKLYKIIVSLLNNSEMSLKELTTKANCRKEWLEEIIGEMKKENKIGVGIEGQIFLK